MKATYETGLHGEEIAEEFLKKKGMLCLERRYRTKVGEIDLIMEDGDTLVFIEVKARFSGSDGQGLQAVNYAKQRRIAKAALLYLIRHKWTRRSIRFDVVEINQHGIIHVPNAFQPGGVRV